MKKRRIKITKFTRDELKSALCEVRLTELKNISYCQTSDPQTNQLCPRDIGGFFPYKKKTTIHGFVSLRQN
jgi:hypothetical protein